MLWKASLWEAATIQILGEALHFEFPLSADPREFDYKL